MKQIQSISLILFLASAVPAFAADNAPAVPAAAASAPKDCGKAVKPHNHGAERGFPTLAGKSAEGAMPCVGAASAPAGKSKSKPLHDHTRMHKTL